MFSIIIELDTAVSTSLTSYSEKDVSIRFSQQSTCKAQDDAVLPILELHESKIAV